MSNRSMSMFRLQNIARAQMVRSVESELGRQRLFLLLLCLSVRRGSMSIRMSMLVVCLAMCRRAASLVVVRTGTEALATPLADSNLLVGLLELPG